MPVPLPAAPPIHPDRRVTWRRLRSPAALGAIAAVCVASIGTTLGTVIAGRLAENPVGGLIGALALCLVGAAVVESAGKLVWVTVVDRAEGRLRDDVLQAAMHQPLGALTEQAVGEILDRVDDDTHEIGNLARWQLWSLFRTVSSSLPMWIVAAVAWWPAAVLFPVLAAVTWFAIRRLLGEIARRKVIEEIAWTDQAAALEEGIAGRNDLRTSLGQAHVIARLARLSAEIHTRFHAVISVESRMARRAGVLLHALLAAITVAGVALTIDGSMSVARLVTLFLVTSLFVGQVA
ncbi:ABC transporter ATP-binding protein, partial [Tsukamurella paurometabola]